MALRSRSTPRARPQPSDLDRLVAATAARVADATISSLRSMFSEQAIRDVIERESKIAVHALLLAEAERARASSAATPPVAAPPALAPAPAPVEGVRPLAYRPKKASEILGISTSTLYGLIADGRLSARKIGSATVIRSEDLDAYVASLPLSSASENGP